MPVYCSFLKQLLHTVDYFSEIAPNVARISVISAIPVSASVHTEGPRREIPMWTSLAWTSQTPLALRRCMQPRAHPQKPEPNLHLARPAHCQCGSILQLSAPSAR